MFFKWLLHSYIIYLKLITFPNTLHIIYQISIFKSKSHKAYVDQAARPKLFRCATRKQTGECLARGTMQEAEIITYRRTKCCFSLPLMSVYSPSLKRLTPMSKGRIAKENWVLQEIVFISLADSMKNFANRTTIGVSEWNSIVLRDFPRWWSLWCGWFGAPQRRRS